MTNNRQSVTVKLLREEDSVFSREPRVVGTEVAEKEGGIVFFATVHVDAMKLSRRVCNEARLFAVYRETIILSFLSLDACKVFIDIYSFRNKFRSFVIIRI